MLELNENSGYFLILLFGSIEVFEWNDIQVLITYQIF